MGLLLAVQWLVLLAGSGCTSSPPGDGPFTVRGSVTDGEAGIAGVVVEARRQGGLADGGPGADRLAGGGEAGGGAGDGAVGETVVASAKSSDDGSFVLGGLVAGTYTLTFSNPDFEPHRLAGLEVAGDVEGLVVVLQPRAVEDLRLGGKVEGRTTGRLTPLAGARVALFEGSGGGPGGAPGGSPLAERTTAADGSFVFEIGPGSYLLHITAAGFAELTSEPIDISDASREDLSFVLEAAPLPGTFAIGGAVSDGQTPLAGVLATLSRVEGGQPAPVGTMSSLADGSFLFRDRAAGTYSLHFAKAGYREAELSPFAVEADLTSLQVVLEPEAIESFRFAVQADLHVYRSGEPSAGLRRIIRGTLEYVRPSFVIFAGDMTSGNSTTTDSTEINGYWDGFFAAISGYLPSHIYTFPSRGNHDSYTAAMRTIYAERWRDLAVPGISIDGDPSSYYSFDFGSSHFTILDGHAVSLGTTQMNWLRQDLAAAQAATHRFVVSHIPLIPRMAHQGHGLISGRTSDGISLKDVLLGGKITALLVGHEHVYDDDSTTIPGIRQVICGTAAGTYNYAFADGTRQELTPSMVVVDVEREQVNIYGVRDAPRFTTTWQGQEIPPPLPRRLSGPPPPAADLLLVDGWQRGSLAARASLRDRASAMFSGLTDAAGRPLSVAVVHQAAVASEIVGLGDYRLAAYLLSNESADDLSLSLREQELLRGYLDGGGRLLLSGSEVGYDLVGQEHGPEFFAQVLRARYLADDAKTGEVSGVSGTDFAGLEVSFDQEVDPWRYPDVVAPEGGALSLMRYSGGRDAAVGWTDQDRGVAYFAFAIDGLVEEAGRRALAATAIRFLGP